LLYSTFLCLKRRNHLHLLLLILTGNRPRIPRSSPKSPVSSLSGSQRAGKTNHRALFLRWKADLGITTSVPRQACPFPIRLLVCRVAAAIGRRRWLAAATLTLLTLLTRSSSHFAHRTYPIDCTHCTFSALSAFGLPLAFRWPLTLSLLGLERYNHACNLYIPSILVCTFVLLQVQYPSSTGTLQVAGH
jgi:hypothetical protein